MHGFYKKKGFSLRGGADLAGIYKGKCKGGMGALINEVFFYFFVHY